MINFLTTILTQGESPIPDVVDWLTMFWWFVNHHIIP